MAIHGNTWLYIRGDTNLYVANYTVLDITLMVDNRARDTVM